MNNHTHPALHVSPHLVILIMLLTITGCSAETKKGSEGYQQPDTESVAVVDATLRLPFQDYQLSRIERTRMQVGHGKLLQECMRRKGFEITVAGDYLAGTQRMQGVDPLFWGGPYGTMPLEHARKYGYKAAPDSPFANGPGFYLSSPSNLSKESVGFGNDRSLDKAYYGNDGVDPTPGCSAQVEEQIDSPLVDLSDLESDLNHLARRHPRLEQSVKKWVECMARNDYSYQDVWEPSRDFGLSPVSQHQIDIATTDVKCTKKSGWANYFYHILTDYQNQAIARDPNLFETALDAETARLKAIDREVENLG